MSARSPARRRRADLSALRARGADPDELFASSRSGPAAAGTVLYPAQEEALIELVSGANVVLATPTGSGKSLVATGAQYAALAAGRRSYYTAPIKALVSEKFFALCGVFGAANVGMLTGDASVNHDAPIIACTAEVLANIALREGADADIGLVVMDEFHFYGDPDRGWAWQVPLLELPKAQFLLMSATLGDVTDLPEDLTRRTGRPTALVANAERPVPLHHYYATTPMHETIQDLLDTRQAPIYVVHFTQASALERAQALMSVNVCSKEEKAAIADLIGGFRFSSAFGTTLSAAGPPRHRRPPRRDAAQVPAAGRAAGPGRAAQGHLRHRHPRRRHQRADPHRRLLRAVASTTAPAPGCCRCASSTRSPAAPGGPATTPPAPSSSRRPSTRWRTSSSSRRSPTTRRSAASWCARRCPTAWCRGARRP